MLVLDPGPGRARRCRSRFLISRAADVPAGPSRIGLSRTRAFRVYWERPSSGRAAPEPPALVPVPGSGPCPRNTSSRSRTCPRPTARRKSSRTSGCRSIRGPRSASSGGNGSGKSTLLRIMAGVDKDFLGTARPAPGITHRLSCRRSRRSTRARTSGATSSRPSPRSAALLDRFDEINARLGEGPDADEMDELLEEQGEGPGRHRGRRRLGPRPAASRSPWTPCGCRPATPRSPPSPAASGGASPCARSSSNGPTSSCSTSRRTTSTPRASPGWSGTCRSIPGTVVAVTHDRYFLDNVAELDPRARPRPGHPLGGELLVLARAEAGPARPGGEAGEQRAARPSPASWNGSACRPGPGWPRTGPGSSATSSSPARRPTGATRRSSSRSRPGRTWATWSSRPRTSRKGYGDRLLFEDMNFRLPPGGIIGVIGPNGAGKTTLFRMIVGQEKPDGGELRVGDTVVISYVDQNRDALNPENTIFQEITGGVDPVVAGQAQGPGAGLRRHVQLQGARPGEEGRQALRRRAEPRPPGQAAQERRQPAAARRADQRPRRRHAPRPRGGPGRLRRLRRGDQPRPLVPRPDRHPHPRLRGGQPRRLVRRQLPDLRGPAPRAARASTPTSRTGSGTSR